MRNSETSLHDTMSTLTAMYGYHHGLLLSQDGKLYLPYSLKITVKGQSYTLQHYNPNFKIGVELALSDFATPDAI